MDVISIHSLHTEGDPCDHTKGSSEEHFNPLPPHGGRHLFRFPYSIRNQNFNPLPPHGGRHFPISRPYGGLHFNPLPPHGGRQNFFTPFRHFAGISIHSLHTEGDDLQSVLILSRHYFNPLPPHGGRRLQW